MHFAYKIIHKYNALMQHTTATEKFPAGVMPEASAVAAFTEF
jgi:hypothetical protein